MSAFKLISSNGNEISFTSLQATDTGNTQPYWTFNRGAEESAGGSIKQQIRPGKRFNKTYIMKLTEAEYIIFSNVVTDQSDDFFIEYVTPPTLLTSDPAIATTNNFKISIDPSPVNETIGADIIYGFVLRIQSVNLL